MTSRFSVRLRRTPCSHRLTAPRRRMPPTGSRQSVPWRTPPFASASSLTACRMCAATPGAIRHSNCWRSCAGSRACVGQRNAAALPRNSGGCGGILYLYRGLSPTWTSRPCPSYTLSKRKIMADLEFTYGLYKST